MFVAAAVVVMHAGRGTTFYYDDWQFVQDRIGWRPHVLLYPHNEHLSLLPVLVYKTLFTIVGLEHYGVYRAVALLFDLTCGLLLFVYVRRRLGGWVALGFASCLVVAGNGAWDIIWPFQIGFLGSLAAGLAALLLLDNRTFRSDIAACAFLAVSISSSSQGLVFAAAVLLETVLRPDRRQRWWVPIVPLALYGLWYLKYGQSSLNLGAGIPAIPSHVFNGLPAGVTTATGLPSQYGGALSIALVAAFVYTATRAELRLPRVLAAGALPLTFWVLMSLARTALPPDEGRYIYPTTVFVIVVAAEAFMRFAPSRPVAIAIAAILGLGALGSAPALNALGDTLRAQSAQARTSITAAELLKGQIDPNTQMIPDQPGVTLAGYERAVNAYGSTIAWDPGEVARRPPADRAAIDAGLLQMTKAAPQAAGGAPPKGCPQIPAGANDTTVALPNRRLYIEPGKAPVEIRLREFADSFPDKAQMQVQPGNLALVALASNRAQKTWTAALRSETPFKACPG